MIHRNSIKSFGEISETLGGRHKAIWSTFKSSKGNLTDRQVKEILGLEDMNSVRPRITELVKNGYLTEVDDEKCPVTGKKVRVCEIAVFRGYNLPEGQLEVQLDYLHQL